jgi:hypothetical protein
MWSIYIDRQRERVILRSVSLLLGRIAFDGQQYESLAFSCRWS